jgi:hypothetical protein
MPRQKKCHWDKMKIDRLSRSPSCDAAEASKMTACFDRWFVLTVVDEVPLHIELDGRRKVMMDDWMLTPT